MRSFSVSVHFAFCNLTLEELGGHKKYPMLTFYGITFEPYEIS